MKMKTDSLFKPWYILINWPNKWDTFSTETVDQGSNPKRIKKRYKIGINRPWLMLRFKGAVWRSQVEIVVAFIVEV